MFKNPQFKNPKFYAMIFIDVLLFVVAILSSYLLRFEFSLDRFYTDQMLSLMLWVIPLKTIIFFSRDLYKGMWRYTSVQDFWLLAQASLLSTVVTMTVILVMTRFEGYSRGVFIIDGFLTFLFTGGMRAAIRTFYSMRANQRTSFFSISHSPFTRVLIVGAGDAGEKILREIRGNERLHYDVAGFVDDDISKQGMSIHGVSVLGTVDRLPDMIKKKGVGQVLIAIPSATGNQIRRIVESCQQCNVSYKILPGIGDLIDGRVSVKLLRDISYEDLLGRLPAQLNVQDIRNYLDHQPILITGCGGSIGSELCRQIIKFQPSRLILLDSCEFNLFKILMELQNEHNFRNCDAILGQVQDAAFMDNIFKKYKPGVVFHAAAYKHVPMLERNPWQAVTNNIIGSLVVIDMAVKHQVGRFVLVSTDKAVRPTNVMGASKRVAELVMQCQPGNGTRFMAVRFGNVVGSSGSVIPVFLRQIEKGGPVTVTHPEIKRFFMTIPEAAQMILQAGTMGNSNEIFVLRMGTAVKIVDMARDLIRLSGKEPDVDINIVYTGLREGEKLYEELITKGEDIMPTDHEKVMVLRSSDAFKDVRNQQETRQHLYRNIEELQALADRYDALGIKKKLQEIVPEYQPQENESVL
jgi:FlaA1/EpsC-like NDP-sugar epimerase